MIHKKKKKITGITKYFSFLNDEKNLAFEKPTYKMNISSSLKFGDKIKFKKPYILTKNNYHVPRFQQASVNIDHIQIKITVDYIRWIIIITLRLLVLSMLDISNRVNTD